MTHKHRLHNIQDDMPQGTSAQSAACCVEGACDSAVLYPRREGVLQNMEQHGVECLDCVSVDNALVRIADPLFAGFCYEEQAECGGILHLSIPSMCPSAHALSYLSLKRR